MHANHNPPQQQPTPGNAPIGCIRGRALHRQLNVYVHWGSVSAVVDRLPPGRHEFGDSWVLTAAAVERGMDLSLLLTVVTAAAIAITVEGRIIDDASLVGGGNYSGGELLVRAVGGPERLVADVLTALGNHVWGG